MTEIGVEKARAKLGDLVLAAMRGETTWLTRYGRRVAAIVPTTDPKEETMTNERFETAYRRLAEATDHVADLLYSSDEEVPLEEVPSEATQIDLAFAADDLYYRRESPRTSKRNPLWVYLCGDSLYVEAVYDQGIDPATGRWEQDRRWYKVRVDGELAAALLRLAAAEQEARRAARWLRPTTVAAEEGQDPPREEPLAEWERELLRADS